MDREILPAPIHNLEDAGVDRVNWGGRRMHVRFYALLGDTAL